MIDEKNGGRQQDGNDATHLERLWTHSEPKATKIWGFLQRVNKKHNLQCRSYDELYQWSVDNISAFWEDLYNFVGINTSAPYTRVSMVNNCPCEI